MLLAASLFFSCKTKKSATAEMYNSNSEIENVILKTELNISEIKPNYKIDSIAINKDILSVFVNYSGGCQKHKFELLFNGMYAKSLPPQATLYLNHISNDDLCKKLIFQEVRFNIASVLNEKYTEIYITVGEFKIKYTKK